MHFASSGEGSTTARLRGAVTCAAVLGAACLMAPGGERPSANAALRAEGTDEPRVSSSLDALPWPERIGLERAMAEADPRHAPTYDEGRPGLASRGVRARFGTGAELSVGGHTATLRAVSLGRGDARVPLAEAPSTVAGAEVRAERAPGVVEWWRSLRSGLEHGVTIAERPAGQGALTLELAVGGLATRGVRDDAVELVDAAGEPVAQYAHLVVTDAGGARLPASMRASHDGITLTVDDAGARYPVVVDPLVTAHEASLLDAESFAGDVFGFSVAFSADGSRALVGAPSSESVAGVATGSARVLVRTGATWTHEATLRAPDAAANDRFGVSVALSGDGSRALVGAHLDDTTGGADAGSAHVFVRTGATWAHETTLRAPDGAAGDELGIAVALTSDGSRALVGAWRYDFDAFDPDMGSAHVFVRTGATWTREARLLPRLGFGRDHFGISVALTADGSRALVGANGDDIPGSGLNGGSARVFARSGSTWTEEASLIPADSTSGDQLGTSVALTADGSRALVGAPSDDTAAASSGGSARVFVRSGTSWTQEASLFPADSATDDRVGASVALSADGTRAFVGAPTDDTPGGGNAGSVRVFARSSTGSTWREEETLVAPDGALGDNYGAAVAASQDGTRVLVGAHLDDTALGTDSGSARVVVGAGTAWSQEATLLAPAGAQNDAFGTAVALSADGSRAIVGAPQRDTASGADAGSARVFVRAGATWQEEATLAATDAAAGDRLGIAVALSSDGSVALVGASGDDTAAGVDSGSARVFVRTGSTWAEQATLLAPDGAERDELGRSVALSADGSRALVGAQRDDTARADTGSARVFVRAGTSWAHEAVLVAADSQSGDELGSAVALSSDGARALVGADRDETARGRTGSARVFVRTGGTWSEEATLLAPDGEPGDRLGGAVALSADGSRALVGADLDDTARGSSAGSARIFVRTGASWAQEATLLAPDGASDDRLGFAVALSSDGSRALVGAHGDDTAAGVDAGSARVFVRTGTTWREEATLLAPDAETGDQLGAAAALAGDGSRALVGADLDDTVGRVGAGSAHVFTVLATNGTACTVGAGCISGSCVDGVCCDSACGGGAVDCQACSVAAGGAVDGVCGALTVAAAAAVTCRDTTGPCDAAEVCSPTSTACPDDVLLPSTTVCRAAVDACDAAETCTGTSAACPSDALASLGTVCRPAAGACDVAEACNGTSVACPADARSAAGTACRLSLGACDPTEVCDGVAAACPADARLVAGTECRPSMGACDPAEACDGASVACPVDVLRPSGTVCRSVAGPCDFQEVCDGASPACPADGVFAAGSTCRPAAGPCDVAEACTGDSALCPSDAFAPDTTVCNALVTDVCDAPDRCTGSSAECPPQYRADVECRPAAGACDVPERCAGDAPACPPDGLAAADAVCRASTASCDPSESCDGASAACPADVSSCEPPVDAGVLPLDGGVLVDAGSALDAAASDGAVDVPDAGPPIMEVGCACRATGPRPAPLVPLTVLAALVVARRRARSQARRT